MVRQIPLNDDYATLVDDEFYDELIGYGWRYDNFKHYPYVSNHIDWVIPLHHKVWELAGRSISPGMVLDHINRDPLDNRLENLRLATPQENAYNRGPWKGRQYKGVSNVRQGYFMARITVNGKVIYLGAGRDPERLADIYDAAAHLVAGEFAYLNNGGPHPWAIEIARRKLEECNAT